MSSKALDRSVVIVGDEEAVGIAGAILQAGAGRSVVKVEGQGDDADAISLGVGRRASQIGFALRNAARRAGAEGQVPSACRR